MRKRRIFLLIPIAVVTAFLLYTWYQIIFTTHWATWRHYTGIILFAPVVYFLFTSYKKALLATGIYLILGTLNLLAITQDILLSWGFNISSLRISLPVFQPALFFIFMLYFILNFDMLVEMKLDNEDAKAAKKKRQSLE